MKIARSITELREMLRHYRYGSDPESIFREQSIGFVPTMGYLHQGHLSLVEMSKKDNDVTVVSIFVNPTQFAPNEDLDTYPRDLDRDSRLLEEMGTDVLFFPDAADIYPEDYHTYVEVEELGTKLCGKSRPSHFRGVVTIVLKLFNMVQPGFAYFGRKDAQQAVIIKKMVADLNLPVTIRTAPIVRDTDGLALSSRNVHLSVEEREAALNLPRALKEAQKMIGSGIRDAVEIRNVILDKLKSEPLIKVDYVEIVRLNNLEPLQTIEPENTLTAAAIWVGKTRLIDNFILGEL